MEDIEQVHKMIGELADKVGNLIGKVGQKEIDRMMREIIDLNDYEIKLTNRRKSKRRRYIHSISGDEDIMWW